MFREFGMDIDRKEVEKRIEDVYRKKKGIEMEVFFLKVRDINVYRLIID